MVDTGIFATTAEVQRKVGNGVSSTSNVEAFINDYVTQVESMINAVTRFNWTDAFSTLNADTKGLLKEAATNFAAIYVIVYDFGSVSRVEMEDRINVLRDAGLRALSLLRDQKRKRFIEDA